ncbi:MAG: carbon-nitrogen family hydrolase [Vicinamibacteria bacterium]|nr:carbon-nitrogen family hydrolase [Vicinamibacteria bacterium]
MIVACCQIDIVWENKPANHDRVRALIDGASLSAGSLILLPEMFSTGFSMDVARISEGSGGESAAFLSELARTRECHVLGGVVARGGDGRGRNEAVLFDPAGREVARYAKLHPFSFGGEERHYAAGESVVTFMLEGWTVAPFICYDLRFPEAFRAAVRRNVELFLVIANWPASRQTHWITLLQARAVENQAYVAGVNRCGRDPRQSYMGRSLIIDPRGRILADGGGAETVVAAELDRDSLLAYRREFPALADMRPHDGSDVA